jgi:hypothetical protein
MQTPVHPYRPSTAPAPVTPRLVCSTTVKKTPYEQEWVARLWAGGKQIASAFCSDKAEAQATAVAMMAHYQTHGC